MPDQRIAWASAFLDKHLHKGPGFGGTFPWQGSLASSQLDDNIADATRFARLHQQVLGQIVALVKQAQRGNPVFQWCAETALGGGTGNRCIRN